MIVPELSRSGERVKPVASSAHTYNLANITIFQTKNSATFVLCTCFVYQKYRVYCYRMKIYLVLDAAEAELWPNADGVP